MHERARCLWRGNLLRIENPESFLGLAFPSQRFGKGCRGEGGWEEEEGEEELAKEDQGQWGAGARPRLTRVNGFQGG